MKKKCQDHLGNEYESFSEMCRKYNISRDVVKRRVKDGWNLGDALTTELIDYTVKDHLGNVYSTNGEMCSKYGLSTALVEYRLSRGWTLKDSLEIPVKSTICQDHLGNIFRTKKEMCKFYNISISSFDKRIKKGMDLEEALTSPSNVYECQDHLGNTFNSKKEMCDYYKITKHAFHERNKKGWSLKRILETKCEKKVYKCQDHLGNEFKNQEEMCNHYGVSLSTFSYRLSHGYSLEKCLSDLDSYLKQTKYISSSGKKFHNKGEIAKYYGIKQYKLQDMPEENFDMFIKSIIEKEEEKQNKRVYDHLGNEFLNYEEMAQHYGMSPQTFNTRKAAWIDKTLEEILITPVKKQHNWKDCKDHLGNTFKNMTEMCNFHNTRVPYFLRRIKDGWSLEDALTAPQEQSKSLGETKVSQILEKLKVEFSYNSRIKNVFDIEEFKLLSADFSSKKLGIIEFDGEQHFTGWPFATDEHNTKMFGRDDLKTKLCKKHKIPLLRIRYDQYSQIEELIEHFLGNPEFYLKRNNKFLTNKQYWSIRRTIE